MHRTGHLGVSLLVFAPVGYLLVNEGLVLVAFLTGATMVWLTMLPDLDHRLPIVSHRGPTHSLLFAGLVGVVFGAAGWVLGDAIGVAGWLLGESADVASAPQLLGGVGFGIGFLTVLAHLLADALTPMGVNFLWPLSGRSFSLSLAPARSRVANGLLFGVGVFASGASMSLALGLV